MSFQLYDRCNKIPDGMQFPSCLSQINFMDVASTINNLSLEHLEIILAIIFHYYCSNNSDGLNNIISINSARKPKVPYSKNIMKGGKGIIYDFNLIPDELKIILYNYTQLTIN